MHKVTVTVEHQHDLHIEGHMEHTNEALDIAQYSIRTATVVNAW